MVGQEGGPVLGAAASCCRSGFEEGPGMGGPHRRNQESAHQRLERAPMAPFGQCALWPQRQQRLLVGRTLRFRGRTSR